MGHRKIRCSCKWCGKGHDSAQHSSHGPGSFKRTHPKYCSKNTCHSPSSPYYKRKKVKTRC